jgi:hypothetical protein
MISSGNMSLITRLDRSVGHWPVCFAVDDVTPSTEALATSDCLAAMQEKLARKIVTSPVQGRQVVAVPPQR